MTDIDGLLESARTQDAHLITKRRVTLVSIAARGLYPADHERAGEPILERHQVVDYVKPEDLDAYIADARTRWQSVDVSDEPDAGPLGYHGPSAVLDFSTPEGEPAAVVEVLPATEGSAAAQALEAAEAAQAEQANQPDYAQEG